MLDGMPQPKALEGFFEVGKADLDSMKRVKVVHSYEVRTSYHDTAGYLTHEPERYSMDFTLVARQGLSLVLTNLRSC